MVLGSLVMSRCGSGQTIRNPSLNRKYTQRGRGRRFTSFIFTSRIPRHSPGYAQPPAFACGGTARALACFTFFRDGHFFLQKDVALERSRVRRQAKAQGANTPTAKTAIAIASNRSLFHISQTNSTQTQQREEFSRYQPAITHLSLARIKKQVRKKRCHQHGNTKIAIIYRVPNLVQTIGRMRKKNCLGG